MIDLFAPDPYSALGMAALLDIEKIPFRRVSTLEDASPGPVVVAARDLSPAEMALIENRASLVLNGGERFAREVFGAIDPKAEDGPCALSLEESVWPSRVAQLARSFGKSALRVPLAPICRTPRISKGIVLAMLARPDGSDTPTPQPGVARRNHCLWSAIDLGAAFANLLTENYLPCRRQHDATNSLLKSWARRLAESAYYTAPNALRGRVQGRFYARLERRLGEDGWRTSEYPIDATGWLLLELTKSLIKRVVGSLVRIARWPAPYGAAATLTHDIEPRRFAYTDGLERLLDTVTATGHPATFGLVARPSARYLTERTTRRLEDHHVICHGLEHRGENVDGRATVAADLNTAHQMLERKLGRAVAGYRSPRLDRSPDLAWALDRSDFRYDSSYPDVDRENIAHFGAGVRLNLPYRPFVDDECGGLRPSRCLELPLTAPDCIQPLFAGAGVETLRRTVESKADYVRATGGLYVALVHGGVFGEDDADVRRAHLEFVHRQLHRDEVWLASLAEIAAWWNAREALRITVNGNGVHVANEGPQTISGARVIIDRGARQNVLQLPPLTAGEEVSMTLSQTTVLPAA